MNGRLLLSCVGSSIDSMYATTWITWLELLDCCHFQQHHLLSGGYTANMFSVANSVPDQESGSILKSMYESSLVLFN